MRQYLVKRGAGLKEVREMQGHKAMAMTLRYAHYPQKPKKKAINLPNGLTGTAKSVMSEYHKSVDIPNSFSLSYCFF